MNYKHTYFALKNLAKFLQERTIPLGDKMDQFAIDFENALKNNCSINPDRLKIMESHLFDDFGWINTLNNHPFNLEDKKRYNELVTALNKSWKP